MAFAPGKIYAGANLRINVTITDGFDVPVDPTTVTFKTCSPCGQITSYVFGTATEVQRSGTGQYLADIAPEEAGRWQYRWQTTGSGTPFAKEGDFIVQASPFFDSADVGYSE